MGSFSAMDEGKVTGLGVCRRRVALRQGNNGRAWAWRFQPPAIPEQPPWQSRPPKSNGDDRPHGPTMRRRLAACLLAPLRICVLLCRFRADRPVGNHPGPNVSHGEEKIRRVIRAPLTSKVLHGIMITDEY
jgi:hypothetical protein